MCPNKTTQLRVKRQRDELINTRRPTCFGLFRAIFSPNPFHSCVIKQTLIFNLLASQLLLILRYCGRIDLDIMKCPQKHFRDVTTGWRNQT